jgi:glycosyltransferase involved in cell wall biosynthesis
MRDRQYHSLKRLLLNWARVFPERSKRIADCAVKCSISIVFFMKVTYMRDFGRDFEGGIYSIQGALLLGWMRSSAAANEVMTVELWIDGTHVGSDTANQTFSELVGALPTAAGHHYALYIPRKFRDEVPHNFSVKSTASARVLAEGQIEFKAGQFTYTAFCGTSVRLSKRDEPNSPALPSHVKYVAGTAIANTKVAAGTTAVFTIVSKNYISYARVLFESIRKFNPQYRLFLCLADAGESDFPIRNDDLFTLVRADQLGIGNFEDMCLRYGIVELNTAVKPFMFRWMLTQPGVDAAIYLDPDIRVYSSFDTLNDLLNTASIVLTPHITAPLAEKAAPNDHHILQSGVFNLGFMAARRCEESLAFIGWWAEKLTKYCVIDFPGNLFVDQKWCDFAPAFLNSLVILKDPGYNVAYWNLDTRCVSNDPDRGWIVNGERLAFFHFSGIDVESKRTLSKYQHRIRWSDLGDCRQLVEGYVSALTEADWAVTSRWPYAYSSLSENFWLSDSLRRFYRDQVTNPTNLKGIDITSYLREMCMAGTDEQATNIDGDQINRFMKWAYEKDEALRTRYDLGRQEQRTEFIEWFKTNGGQRYGLPPALRLDESHQFAPCNSVEWQPGSLPANMATTTDSRGYFTICSKNFLAHARVLYFSLRKHYPETRFYVVLCDEHDGMVEIANEPFDFIFLEDLNLPDLEGMSKRYNITEFNTAVKPFAFTYLFESIGLDTVTYLDPDLLIIDKMIELDSLLAHGAEAVLTPHLLQPAEHDQIHDQKMLIFGIYNLGFVAMRNTENTRNFVAWWGRRLVNDCVIKLEEGLFVDQKWADLMPAYVAGTRILHHPGYNVAYWNLPQRKITRIDDQWFANELPLRFLHFSGNKIDDPLVFSRHSQQVTIESIGPLADLLDYYRTQVFEQGHAHYRKLPYAYSWNGESGKNEHTPAELDASRKNSATIAPNATTAIVLVDVRNERSRDRLLYIDWEVPKADRDAASVTAVLLMKIFGEIGYDVTFLPCSLVYEAGYVEKLNALGVTVKCSPEIDSVQPWLVQNASRFDICFLARGPVVWPVLHLLRQHAPNTRLIFNTVDLHFVREMRQAELAHDDEGLRRALTTRDQELDLIRECDLTIVLSSEELYTIRTEMPDARLAVLPIIFEQIPGALSGFDARRDILFIGSFPHLPNIDAVVYFAEEIFPLVLLQHPHLRFKIVGSKPPEEIRRLAAHPNIDVLGYVEDLEPLFESIRLSIAPLRYGAGIKGKIGSSLCYGVPCIATPIAVEGMGLADNREVLVGATPKEYADKLCRAYADRDLWQRLSRDGVRFARDNYSMSVIRERVRTLFWAARNVWRPLESLVELEDWSAWQRHLARMGDIYQTRLQRELALLPTQEGAFHTEGFCCVCGVETRFITDYRYASVARSPGRTLPNWREQVTCEQCRFCNRVRAAINVLHTLAVPDQDAKIYITENVTRTYDWLAVRYPNLQGSEYLGPDYAPGAIVDNIRHEDLMNLSFEAGHFNAVISLDVLEHVPDPVRACREVYRVMAPGATFIFSAPFSSDSYKHKVRATLGDDGTVSHMLPPEYHGNPVDPKNGALCYRYFGWEILDDMRAVGFVRVRVLAYWSEYQGYLGREQYLIIACK